MTTRHVSCAHARGCDATRAGVITYLTQMVDGADFVAIMLRAGFSLAAGSIKEYVCGSPGQDAVAGRCAVGFMAGKDFGALPPHWAVGGLAGFLTAVGGWSAIMPSYDRWVHRALAAIVRGICGAWSRACAERTTRGGHAEAVLTRRDVPTTRARLSSLTPGTRRGTRTCSR